MSGDVLTVLLADDHPVVLTGLRALVQSDPELSIVGEAKDGRAALLLARQHKPDVVVLDVSMPEMGAAEVAAVLLAERPDCRILVMTVHEDRATLRRMLGLGVAGYLLKRTAPEELPRAIKVVAAGGMYLDPAIAGKVLGVATPQGPFGAADQASGLSEREGEVLRMVASGHSNKEISAQLEISIKTVETYKSRAMEKLGFRTRVDLVRYAVAQGWLVE
jgi:DNA-binding NarL/FixJ family response regulator